MQTRYKLLHKWGHATLCLKRLFRWNRHGPSLRQIVKPSLWLVFLSFWDWQNTAFSSLIGKKLCDEKQHPPSHSRLGWPLPNVLLCSRFDADWAVFKELTQMTWIARISMWVSLSSCKPLSSPSPLPQSECSCRKTNYSARNRMDELWLTLDFDAWKDMYSSSWRLHTAGAHKQFVSTADL